MKIQILGSGCATCQKLYEQTKLVVSELSLNADVEHLTDISKIIELGLTSSPVLTVDGIPVMVGAPASLERLKQVIQKGIPTDLAETKTTCSCGGKC